MVALINPIRKALPGMTLHRSFGRGMVWWYVKQNGEYLRGLGNANRVIKKISKHTETWKEVREFEDYEMTLYYFICRDNKGKLLGVGRINPPDPREGSLVLIDEIPIFTEEAVVAFHQVNGKVKNKYCTSARSVTYERIS